MKTKLFPPICILLFAFFILPCTAQVPESFSYQVIVRDASGNPLQNQNVSFRFSIIKGSIVKTTVFTEKQSAVTNSLGLVNLAIGNGTDPTGSIVTIDWGADIYSLKVEIDPTGGSAYTEMGTTQLLSVPYARYARFADTAFTHFEVDPVFITHPAYGISSGNIEDWAEAYNWGNHALMGYVPGTRTITINSTAYDLTADRSWSVGTVTSVGLSMPALFSVSGSPVTGSGTLSAELVSQSANLVFASPSGSAGAPLFRSLDATDIPNLDWTKITTGKPTTLTGYSITDGVNTSGNQTIDGNKTFTGTTTVQAPVNATDAATKAYVDELKIMILDLQAENGVTDARDGTHYSAVRIGNQIWLAENIAYLPVVHSNAEFETQGNSSQPGYGVYGYDGSDVAAAKSQANYTTYGVLYNWYAVNSANICPTGWHVPTDAEWTILTTYLGGTVIAGGKLKETGTAHWISPNTGATNETGFTALPGGFRHGSNGSYINLGLTGNWWSSTEYSTTDALYRDMNYNIPNVNSYNHPKKYGFSVRCVKDY